MNFPFARYDAYLTLNHHLRKPEVHIDLHYVPRNVAFPISDKKHTVTVSIGISICLTNNCNIETLIQDADNNMYRAKQQGKNQIVLPS